MNKGKLKVGVSLITLVVTIVIIVILVGAIVLSISNNNPINQASKAVFRNDLTSMKEQYAIEYASALGRYKGNADLIEIGDFSSNIIPEKYSSNFEVTTSGIAIKSKNTLTEEEKAIAEEIFQIVEADPLDGVKIPEGFYYVGGTKDKGVVISDNVLDKDKGDSYEVAKTLTGNQYVWVPITSESEFVRKEWNKGYTIEYCSEPYASGYSTEVYEYDEMKAKVIENQGFYIARYEASNNNTVVAESKALRMPWNNIAWNKEEAMNIEPRESSASYEGRHASEKLGYKSVQSTLIYGVQWDNALKFIEASGTSVEDSTSWGNYSNATFDYTTSNGTATKENNTNTLIPTGAAERHMKQNISDMAGNIWEWTMEAYSSTGRNNRGGGFATYGTDVPATFRNNYEPMRHDTSLGFRVALYVK